MPGSYFSDRVVLFVTDTRQTAVFGRRREPHTVIIASGDRIRHFTVRPWLAALAGSALAAIAIGYLLATSYLVFRDNLMGAAAARQAQVQQAYEDRISALRAQVDRITSRQLLDQQLVENKVSELLQRQALLTRRHGRLEPILERAEKEAGLPAAAPVPEERPEKRAAIDASSQPKMARLSMSLDLAPTGSVAPTETASTALSFWSRDKAGAKESAADHADRLFVAINKSLRDIEADQITRIATLTDNADKRADAITEAIESAGLKVDPNYGNSDMGGPLLPVDNAPSSFEVQVQALDEALDRLDAIKTVAATAPIDNPARGFGVSSGFGVRRDPILGKPALHSGMDFRVPYGHDVHPSGTGTVTKAGWNGGYGRMVEVDHGNGVKTRYAHLSKILVSVGDHVDRSTIVGKSGSSGRSTGPHLHYEVRKDGKAVNPLPFLKAGNKVSRLL